MYFLYIYPASLHDVIYNKFMRNDLYKMMDIKKMEKASKAALNLYGVGVILIELAGHCSTISTAKRGSQSGICSKRPWIWTFTTIRS